MRKSSRPKPKFPEPVANPQADSLATWEDEGGTTVLPGSRGVVRGPSPAAPVPAVKPRERS